jgi:UDP-N-acetylmuramoyl-tripeptide--D-alanyl-D-alanine ligase
LRVADTLVALEALGVAARSRCSAKAIAVTGSVGKTGTKEALKLALGVCAPTHASAASYNNQWGVPLSLARMPRLAVYGIFEIGMNHAGEIGPLTRMVRPDVAVVTSIAPVHLAFFDSVAAIADAKAEIFEGMGEGGFAVLNEDSPHFDRLAVAARHRGIAVHGFGAAGGPWARLVEYTARGDAGTVVADIGGREVRYEIGVAGRHWAMNTIAVLATVEVLGANLEGAARALTRLTPPKGRGARHTVYTGAGNFLLIDESYNANPASVRAAFETLAAASPEAGGRRIAILGDMRELGEDAAAMHAALADDLIAAKVDLVLTAGAHMAHLHEALPRPLQGQHAADSAALVPAAVVAVSAGDVVMVKGSLATGMGCIVEALRDLNRMPRAVNDA